MLSWLLFLLYWVSFCAIVIGYVWTIVMFFAGYGYFRTWRRRPVGREEDYLWVFLVPALNEEVTIADSVARLRAVQATHKVILVINDGSDDSTGAILEGLAGPDLEVLTRVPPDARTGKAAALNAAYHRILTQVMTRPEHSGFDTDHVIIGIVDADGRLAAQAPAFVARHFDEPEVGGVQCMVHIYNQESYLTWMQGLEFEIFGGLFQAGRSRLNTAFMGGNGQFNRLSSLQSIGNGEGEDGPWGQFLTEDQELGLRELRVGWWGRHELFTTVSQQGLNSLTKLWRQRTRWFQGNLQVLGHVRDLYSRDLYGFRRLDALFTLVLPILQLIVGTALLVAIILWVFFGVPYLPLDNGWLTAFFVQLSLGPVIFGVLIAGRGRGWAGVGRIALVFVPYVVYTWIMWPVVFMGTWRRLSGRSTWAKTARERISSEPAQDALVYQDDRAE